MEQEILMSLRESNPSTWRDVWDHVWRMILEACLKEHVPLDALDLRGDVVEVYCREKRIPIEPLLDEDDYLDWTTSGLYEVFYRRLRTEMYPRYTVMLCVVKFCDGETHLIVTENEYEHAELNALNKIEEIEEYKRAHVSSVQMYICWSPCLDCSRAINSFCFEKKGIDVYIRFPSVYNNYTETTHEALKILSKCCTLHVFRNQDWDTLSQYSEIL